MDLHKTWQKISQDKFSNQTINKKAIMEAIQINSKNPMNEIRKGLFIKTGWIALFTLICLALLYTNWGNSSKVIILSLFLAYFLIGLIVLPLQISKLNRETDMTNNLKNTLRDYYTQVKQIINFEQTFGLFFFPIAIIGGFFYGAISNPKYGSIDVVLGNQRMVITLLVLVSIMVPLMYLLGKKLNNIAFGSYLKQLKSNINSLEKLED